MGKITYSLRLQHEEYDRIVRDASVKGQSVREWIRRAIKARLEAAKLK